ncbi:MAG: hypothetical protein M1837_003555 [Sclerophora amabilis]|nr:MAG: hypothetical protein M1837_003555 [Sclerophora amabilis]
MYSDNSSPDYGRHNLPTPAKSPVRQHGPILLPKIRSQDQHVEPSPAPLPRRHRKALSTTQNPPASIVYSRPSATRRSASPAGVCEIISPVSNRSNHSRMSSSLSSPISLTRSHSRKPSASHIDDQILGKYGFPTYRQLPTYVPPPVYAPSYMPGAATYVPPPTYLPQEYVLPMDLQYTGAETTTTLLDYLTSPNPTPELVSHININANRGPGQTHFWWDIRNLRSWNDFSLKTMKGFRGFWDILNVEVPSTSLPVPRYSRAGLHPETEASLHELCRDFYADKVNNSLKVSQFQRHLRMRAEPQMSYASRERRPAPHFVSNYQDDVEKTIFGEGRGRVVGLVKSFDRWNTGMRAEAPHKKVEYLLGLSHLHRHMREHGCRYGFIITEIELVCVRAGVEDIPHFGFLELSPTIQLKTSGPYALTAGLALWYLHMLAKEQPLPGQAGWRIDVGGAVACHRQKCLEKDDWIPNTSLAERREARRVRGWISNTDPLSRKEFPNRRRTSVQVA